MLEKRKLLFAGPSRCQGIRLLSCASKIFPWWLSHKEQFVCFCWTWLQVFQNKWMHVDRHIGESLQYGWLLGKAFFVDIAVVSEWRVPVPWNCWSETSLCQFVLDIMKWMHNVHEARCEGHKWALFVSCKLKWRVWWINPPCWKRNFQNQ